MPSKLQAEYTVGDTHFMLRIPRHGGSAATALLDIELFALVKSISWTYNSGSFTSRKGITLNQIVSQHFDLSGGRKDDNDDYTKDNFLASKTVDASKLKFDHLIEHSKEVSAKLASMNTSRYAYVKGNSKDVLELDVIIDSQPKKVRCNRGDMRLIPLRATIGRHGIVYLNADGSVGKPVMNKILIANGMGLLSKVALHNTLDLSHDGSFFSSPTGAYCKIIDDGESEVAVFQVFFESDTDLVAGQAGVSYTGNGNTYCVSIALDAENLQHLHSHRWFYSHSTSEVVATFQEYDSEGNCQQMPYKLKRYIAELCGRSINNVFRPATPNKRYAEAAQNPDETKNARYLSKIHSANTLNLATNKRPFKPAKTFVRKAVYCKKTGTFFGISCIDMRASAIWVAK